MSSNRPPPVIVWFRTDLRLADQPALTIAAQRGAPVIALYIDETDLPAKQVPGAASRWWLHHSLAALHADLRQLGNRLVLRRGSAAQVLTELVHESGAQQVLTTRRYTPFDFRRDPRLTRQLAEAGATFKIFHGNLLAEPEQILNKSGLPYRVFTPYWRTHQHLIDSEHLWPAPTQLPAATPCSKGLALEELKLLPDIDWAAGLRAEWQCGEAAARQRLAELTPEALAAYPETRDRPDLAGTTRLSPHLHFGELSVRQVAHQLRRLMQQGPAAVTQGAAAVLRQLVWRDFAHHVLFHFPHTIDQPFDKRFAAFPWQTRPTRVLRAWQQGRTGFPIVDAGMRELWHTGWMHNRVRMIVASLLTKHAGLHWRLGARWFQDTLVDADLAQNTMNWQWVAGCGVDAAPYFRIFNPLRQGEKFDPLGSYVRHWLPELARLPTRYIHAPWLAPAGLLQEQGLRIGRDYPAPILELASQREAALRRYQQSIRGN